MSDELTLVAEPRNTSGKGEAGRMRRQGLLPAVVYGEGNDASLIQIKEHEIDQMLRHHAGGNVLVNLTVGTATPSKVLLKDVQVHPVSGRILHADFQAISMTEKLIVTIPVELVGTPTGVSQQGGTIEQMLREVEVECLPADIIENFELDVTGLEINDSIEVKDIPLDRSKFTLITGEDLAVAHVSPPRVEEEPEEEEGAEAAEGGEEPEVIGEKKEEGSEGDGGE